MKDSGEIHTPLHWSVMRHNKSYHFPAIDAPSANDACESKQDSLTIQHIISCYWDLVHWNATQILQKSDKFRLCSTALIDFVRGNRHESTVLLPIFVHHLLLPMVLLHLPNTCFIVCLLIIVLSRNPLHSVSTVNLLSISLLRKNGIDFNEQSHN